MGPFPPHTLIIDELPFGDGVWTGEQTASAFASVINGDQESFGVTAEATLDKLRVTALIPGEVGNAINTTTTLQGASFLTATLVGGLNPTPGIRGQACIVGDAPGPYEVFTCVHENPVRWEKAGSSEDTALRSAENTFTARQTFSKQVALGVVPLADAASITWDAALGNLAAVTLGGNRTLANPSNTAPGTYLLVVTQDATGGRTLAFGSNFRFPDATPPELTPDPDAVDVLTFISMGGGPLYLVAQNNFLPAP